jgi:hypothetical protein
MFRAAITILAIVCLSSNAYARDVSVGPVTIKLTTPGGACEADPGKAADARYIAGVKGMIANSGNTLLAAYADCQQFAAWRVSKLPYLPHTYQYQSFGAYAEKGVPDSPSQVIKTTCNELREQGKKYAENDFPDMRDRAKNLIKKVEVTGSAFFGVVAEDPDACYAANLQQFKISTGALVKQIALWATVVVKNRVVFYYDYAPYSDENSVNTLVEELRPQVAAFLAANK